MTAFLLRACSQARCVLAAWRNVHSSGAAVVGVLQRGKLAYEPFNNGGTVITVDMKSPGQRRGGRGAGASICDGARGAPAHLPSQY